MSASRTRATGDPVAPRGLGFRVGGLHSGLPSDVRAMGITGGMAVQCCPSFY